MVAKSIKKTLLGLASATALAVNASCGSSPYRAAGYEADSGKIYDYNGRKVLVADSSLGPMIMGFFERDLRTDGDFKWSKVRVLTREENQDVREYLETHYEDFD